MLIYKYETKLSYAFILYKMNFLLEFKKLKLEIDTCVFIQVNLFFAKIAINTNIPK